MEIMDGGQLWNDDTYMSTISLTNAFLFTMFTILYTYRVAAAVRGVTISCPDERRYKNEIIMSLETNGIISNRMNMRGR